MAEETYHRRKEAGWSAMKGSRNGREPGVCCVCGGVSAGLDNEAVEGLGL